MVGRATLTTVPSSIAMLDPSTVAASTHRPCLLVSRIAPDAGDTAATTLLILSPRRGALPSPRAEPGMFTVRDTYGVDVAPGEDDAMLLAAAACLDRLHREGEERH